jgi:phosphate butyryltransferase
VQKNILKSFNDIYNAVKKINRPTSISVIFPHYIEIIIAIKKALEEKLANFLLIGSKNTIEKLLREQNIPSLSLEIINNEEEINATFEGIKLIKEGKANILMKGDIKTSTLLKCVLDKENGLRSGRILSHIYVAEVTTYHKLIIMSDGGLSILPDINTKIAIIKNAVEFANHLGIETPKVALLAPIETVNPDIPETIDADKIVKMCKNGELPLKAEIEGPVALDIAISQEAAKIKKVNSKIAGDTDIFIVPNITSGNLFGKCLIYFAKAKAGGIVWGAKAPIALLSRADDWQTKLRSILLAIISCTQ